jgi:hypothetical protein
VADRHVVATVAAGELGWNAAAASGAALVAATWWWLPRLCAWTLANVAVEVGEGPFRPADDVLARMHARFLRSGRTVCASHVADVLGQAPQETEDHGRTQNRQDQLAGQPVTLTFPTVDPARSPSARAGSTVLFPRWISHPRRWAEGSRAAGRPGVGPGPGCASGRGWRGRRTRRTGAARR